MFHVIETVGIAQRADGSASNIHYRNARDLAPSTVAKLVRDYRKLPDMYGTFTDHVDTDGARIVRATTYFRGVLNIHELRIASKP